MQENWQEFKISQTRLEELLNFDLSTSWAMEVGRILYLKRKDYRSLVVSEICGWLLICLLFFPVVLILFRNAKWLSNNSAGLFLVMAIATFGSLVLLIAFNYYLWRKAKQLKIFVVLLDKVKQYNHLIDNLELISRLNAVTTIDIPETKEIVELKTALNLTKNSLLQSIELEKIINRDRYLANNREQLLANLESGLINLDSLSQIDTQDYDQLFSEAIAIGLSVHREVRKNHF